MAWLPNSGKYSALVSNVLNNPSVEIEETVPREKWDTVILQKDTFVQIRAVTEGGDDSGTNPIAVIGSLAIALAAPYLAGFLPGALTALGTPTALFHGYVAGISIAGALVFNSLFPPRLPEDDQTERRRQYTLQGGRNRIRRNERILIVIGTHRVFPDVAAQPYVEFGGQQGPNDYGTTEDINVEARERIFTYVNGQRQLARTAAYYGTGSNGTFADQFLNQIFDFGIGEMDITDLKIGETPLESYDEVEFELGAPVTKVAGNVDTLTGAELEHGKPLERSTAKDTVRIAVDLVSQYIEVERDGDVRGKQVNILVRHRVTDSGDAWTVRNVQLVSPNGPDGRLLVRRTHTFRVPKGAHDIQVELTTQKSANEKTAKRETLAASVTGIKAYQPQTANFDGRNPMALRIKASAQIHGTVDRLSGMVSHKIVGVDKGEAKVTSNPADWAVKWLLGWRLSDGRLAAGVGAPDKMIDYDAFGKFWKFCKDNKLECNAVVDQPLGDREFLELILKCGWGFLDTSAGKYSVVWEAAGIPRTAIFTPANIVAGSLEVSWNNQDLSDEIIGRYNDKDSDYGENTVERLVPGTETPENSTTVTLAGITNGEQAAKEINRMAAAQHFHRRNISFETTQSGFHVSLGNVVGLAHGLVGGSVGGRLLRIDADDRQIVELSNPPDIPEGGTFTIWIWYPNNTVASMKIEGSGDAFRVEKEIPDIGKPATSYVYMAFDPATPPVDAQITGIEPLGLRGYRLHFRDEVAEYYAARTADLTNTRFRNRNDPPVITGLTITDTLEDIPGGQQVWLNIAVEQTGRPVESAIRINGEFVGVVPYGESVKFPSPVIKGTITVSATPGPQDDPQGIPFEKRYDVQGVGFTPEPPAGYSVTNEKLILTHAFTPSPDPTVDRYEIKYKVTALEELPVGQVALAAAAGDWDAMTDGADKIQAPPVSWPAALGMNGKIVVFALRSVNSKGVLSAEIVYAGVDLIPVLPSAIKGTFDASDGQMLIEWEAEVQQSDNLSGFEVEGRIKFGTGEPGPWQRIGTFGRTERSTRIPWIPLRTVGVDFRVRGIAE